MAVSIRIPLLLAVLAAAALQAGPARAWIFEEDGVGWPLFGFHRYGGDVNRPPVTPDRPYFHGDDAVPLDLRWRDLEAARAQAAAEDAAAAAALVTAAPPPRVVVRHQRHRRIVRRTPRLCVPATASAAR